MEEEEEEETATVEEEASPMDSRQTTLREVHNATTRLCRFRCLVVVVVVVVVVLLLLVVDDGDALIVDSDNLIADSLTAEDVIEDVECRICILNNL